MSGPELPVIYENPRFDAATPTLKPVIDRAVRFGGVLMLEWGSLTLIEDSPRYLKWTTVVIAILILAVHESWPWLRLRSRRLYPTLMVTLVGAYGLIFAYAFITEPPKTHTQPVDNQKCWDGKAPPCDPVPPKVAPSVETELAFGPYVRIDIDRMIPIFIALNDALSQRAAPLYEIEQHLTGNWQNQFRQMGATAYASKLKDVATQMLAARAEVYKIVTDNDVYRNETDTAVRDGPNAVDAFANAVGYFIDNLDAVTGLSEAKQFQVLNKDIQRIEAAGNGYNSWVQKSIQNVRTKIRRLRDYKA